MKQFENSPASKQHTPFQKVLVTGGLGFIGAHVYARFRNMAFEAVPRILDCVTYAADHRRLVRQGYPGRKDFVRGDIRNPKDVEQALRGCDAVVHLAAETHVPRSFTDPRHFFDVNVTGTETLVAAAHRMGIQHFVHVSTDEVYGPATQVVNENAPMRPTTPYATSKALAEEAVMLAAHKGMRCSILRPTNAVGVGQNPEKLFPRFVMQALKGLPLTIEGTGRQERSFLPVSDLVDAIARVLNRTGTEDLAIFNVAGRENLTVANVAKLVFEVTGSDTGLTFVEDRQQNDEAYRLDDREIRKLGFVQQSSARHELDAILADFSGRQCLLPEHLQVGV